MTGSQPDPSTVVVLLDASLADRPVAAALRLVDYSNAVAVSDRFGEGVEDPIVIQWLGLQGGLWVTMDERARHRHAAVIEQSGIHVLWVRRPKSGMSKRQQLYLLLGVLDSVLEQIKRTRLNQSLRFLAKYSGERPRVERLQ